MNYFKDNLPYALSVEASKRRWKGLSPFLQDMIFNPPLRSVAIEINSACNRKCGFCPNNGHVRKSAYLKKELVYKVIDEMRGMKFKGALCFHLYNEPLLDKRLPEFIRYARERLPSVYIYVDTNGDMLDLPGWEKLRKAGLDFMLVGQYDGKINDNVRSILKSARGSEKKHLMARLFDIRLAGNRAGLVKTVKPAKLPFKKYCSRPFYQLCINYKGKAVLCHNDYLGQVEIADVRKEPVSKIWQSKILRYYRKKLFFSDRAGLVLCSTCDNVQSGFGLAYNKNFKDEREK